MPIRFFSCVAFILSVVCSLFGTFHLFGNDSIVAYSLISTLNFLICSALLLETFVHIFVLKFSVTRAILIEAILICICSRIINSWYAWVTFFAMIAIILLSIGQQILDNRYVKEEEELKELRKLNFK
ncbi:hypothetical protein [Fluviispira multicolorata]|uniref:Uncharacterized protein n=1 Tax=Fluviispira multicolorata TaxID=2654512 RepID=A0A833JDV2_9BACT|nr:hypothetical protein [Fluviispira multicolorata]KAB8032073.1 hypothetical protein GCL57_05340 [Fluviispira multicolorata]